MTKTNSTSKAGKKPVEKKKVEPVADLGNVKKVSVPKDIQSIKHLLTFLFSIAYATKKSLRDGKFKIHELLNYRESLTLVTPAVKSVPNIKEEILDLTDEEIDELTHFIAEKFKLDNKAVEAKIENLIALGAQFLKIVV